MHQKEFDLYHSHSLIKQNLQEIILSQKLDHPIQHLLMEEDIYILKFEEKKPQQTYSKKKKKTLY